MLVNIKFAWKYVNKEMYEIFAACIGPKFEYTSPVWPWYLKKHADLIEKVLWRATVIMPELREMNCWEWIAANLHTGREGIGRTWLELSSFWIRLTVSWVKVFGIRKEISTKGHSKKHIEKMWRGTLIIIEWWMN